MKDLIYIKDRGVYPVRETLTALFHNGWHEGLGLNIALFAGYQALEHHQELTPGLTQELSQQLTAATEHHQAIGQKLADLRSFFHEVKHTRS